ncbi:MAG TPA: ferritin-like domain-containing protein [Polyangiaceae bacterium]|nr:ferritin-like domain-containing protein [Polyangiaceae bacterium]
MSQPEPRVDIRDREELLYLLSEAAAFEHTVMCSYLFALWTLKRPGEGLSEREAAAVARWRGQMRTVVLEEMVHLTLVNNLIAAFGGAAQLSRPDFPVAAGYFPSELVFTLTRCDEETLQHFMYLERPEEIDLKDGVRFVHPAHFDRAVRSNLMTPTPHDYESQGQLYHEIGLGIVALAQELGEAELFCGHRMAQVDGQHFALPGIFVVDDVASAQRAIEEIVLQGEGAPAHRDDSHYARFKSIHDEMVELRMERPDFEPCWPAVENPWLDLGVPTTRHTLVAAEPARHVVDLGNSIYALTLRCFAQVFSPHPLPPGLRAELSSAASGLMQILGSAGEVAARLPVAPGSSTTAGLSFQLPRSNGPLVQASAAKILSERALELSHAASELGRHPALASLETWRGVAAPLEQIAQQLARLHDEYEAELLAALPDSWQPSEGAAARARLPLAPAGTGAADDASDPNTASSTEITIHFDSKRCIHSRHCVLGAPRVFLANVEGPWLHPENASAEQLTEIAHACPSGAITYERHDGGPQEGSPQVNVLYIRENGPLAVHADIELEGHGRLYRTTLCRCGQSKNKPFCDGAHNSVDFHATGEPPTEASEPLNERAGTLHIRPLPNGPNEVRGNLEILAGTGRRVRQVQSVRLCRCGGSANKPYCDGTHTRIGFRSDA